MLMTHVLQHTKFKCLNFVHEIQADIEAAGTGRFVDETLEAERVKERDTLQKLVEENVRLERELTKNKELLR